MEKRYYFIDSLGKKIFVKLLAWQFSDSFVFAEDYFKPEKKYHIYRGRISVEEVEEESLVKLEV